MKPLVVIPARGGSKRVPDKNIKLLAGKPLILYTIEVARAVFEDNIICVSTDSLEIKKIVEASGLKVPFLRPKELAQDSSDSRSVFLHAYEFYKNNYGYEAEQLIVLQPTSPFRTKTNLLEAMELFQEPLDMVVSVKETASNPYFVLFEENQEGYLVKSKKGSFTRKQDAPKVWEFNGAIYIISKKAILKGQPFTFKKSIKYVMSELESIDIDTPLDWEFASLLIQKSNQKN